MKKPIFSLNRKDKELEALVAEAGKRTLAIWAIACVERVLPHFECSYPKDKRPIEALKTLHDWINTGQFSMKVIRHAALAAHAAAREVGEDNAARSAARAAGQAVSTAHVKEHALAASYYALQAIFKNNIENDPEVAVAIEREWQFHCLSRSLRKE
jgi:hypothetical protein